MDFLRLALSVFAILNVVFWALLAWTWAVKPSWAARLPLQLGTDQRYQASVPVWARLAPPPAALWAGAGGPSPSGPPPHPVCVFSLSSFGPSFPFPSPAAPPRASIVSWRPPG